MYKGNSDLIDNNLYGYNYFRTVLKNLMLMNSYKLRSLSSMNNKKQHEYNCLIW